MGRISFAISALPAAQLLIPSAAGLARGVGLMSGPSWLLGAGAVYAARGRCHISVAHPRPWPRSIRSTRCLGFRVHTNQVRDWDAIDGRGTRPAVNPSLMG